MDFPEIWDTVYSSEYEKFVSDSAAITMTDEPHTVETQWWSYSIESITSSDRLPDGVSRADCREVNQFESYYKEKGINDDGSACDGYFFIVVKMTAESVSGCENPSGRDDGVWNINQLTLYAKDAYKSTYIYPDYIDKSCYDPERDANDPGKGYDDVYFGSGGTELTMYYLVREKNYEEYENWDLLLNMIGVPAHDYDRLLDLNGEPPFEKIRIDID